MVATYASLSGASASRSGQSIFKAGKLTTNMAVFLLQRFPIVAHVSMLALCIAGPLFAPHALALVVVVTHIIFFLCQTRSAYGVYSAWAGVRAHAQRDWRQHFESQVALLEANDEAEHVLPLEQVQHVILLPAYKEEMATLRETLDVLASHPMARSTYHVCLGMEEREEGAQIKAQMLTDAYRAKGRFADITYSLHPGNIVGESAGKSSNVNWAARRMAARRGISSMRAIFTVMDADTAFASDFFLASSVHFALATVARRRRMMFVPPTLFDRNGRDVPIFTRVTDIFWSCAGIGGIYPSSSVKIPTSAYGVSMELARFCDYWDAGPEAIGEDLHFYCKAMFETKGNVEAVTIYSPASQMNVVGKGGRTAVTNYVNDMNARWVQAVRHMWGSLDFGYCCHRLLFLRFGRSAPREGYMAVRTAGEGSISSEDDEEAYGMGSDLSTPMEMVFHSRTASPSVSVATDVSDESAITRVDLSRSSSTASTRVGSNGDKYMHPAEAQHLALPTMPFKLLQSDATLTLDEEEQESQVQDAYDEQGEAERLRLFPILLLMTRLYEAHLMIAQVTLFGLFLGIYPSVIYRNGLVVFTDPFNRACTLSDCLVAMLHSPFAAGVNLPADTAPGMHPSWMLPTILMCATKAAHLFGGMGIAATVLMCIFHDCYHNAATARWNVSDRLYREWSYQQRTAAYHPTATAGQSSQPVPARYLGMRPHQTFARKWPAAILDFAAVPAAIMYGVAPLVWAQVCHLWTNRLTYTVSAKSKSIVIVPTVNASRQSLDRRRGPSMEMARLVDRHEKSLRGQ